MNKQNAAGILATAILLSGAACTPKNTYTITGTLPDNSAEGSMVYMTDYHTNKYTDSAVISGNTFTFTGTIQADSIRRIDVPKTNGYANFILEQGQIQLTLAGRGYKVSGTPKNEIFAQMDLMQETQFQTSQTMWDKFEKDSTLTPEQKQEKFRIVADSLTKNYQVEMEKIAAQYPNSSISTYAIWNIQMSDPQNKNYTTIKELLGKDLYAANFQPVMNLLKKGEQLLITAEGKPFLDFTIENGKPEGGKVSLSDYVGKGKYILVDFWASWCGPCVGELPNIKNVYDTYKGTEFDVLSVAVWDEQAESLKGIKEHGMTWPQIINAPEEVANLYGINGIPHIILFGPDGTILKRGLRGEAMVNAVKEALGKK